MNIGVYLLGPATIAAGILDLIWGEFDAAHQPIGAVGNTIPGHTIFAYIAAIWMIFAGEAMLWRRTIRVGAWATAIVYFIFGLFPLTRFYTTHHRLDFHLTLTLTVIAGMLSQFIVVAGCIVLYASFAPRASRWPEKSPLVSRFIFGLSGVLFGVGHLAYVRRLVPMIPKWMPFGAPFWVVISGIGFLLAGLAILSGIFDLLASRLLALMLLIFEVALVPIIFAHSHVHVAWGSTAYNLAVAGAVCIFAASIATRHSRAKCDAKAQLSAAA